MKLSNNQKKFLRSMGHTLKPVVMVGQQGLSEAVLAELKQTIAKHELLKIKIRTENRDTKQQIIRQIIAFSGVHLVQVIGNIVVIYCPFDKDPHIILPRR